jgi:hypothetical protein
VSTRTIIEINHDRLNDLIEDRSFLRDFLMMLRAGDKPDFEFVGIRFLAQRHHADKITLEVE